MADGADTRSASSVSELTVMHAGSIFALLLDADLDLGIFRIERITPFGGVVVTWWSVHGPTCSPQRPGSAIVIIDFGFGLTPLP